MALDMFFERIANPYVALLALVILIGSTYIIGRLNPSEEIQKSISVPYVSVGTNFGYRAEDLYRMLDAFNSQANGKELKEKYRRFFYYDLIYPWFYALSAAILIAYLQRSFNATNPVGMHFLWMLPILAGVFDYGENLSLLSILSNYDGTPLKMLDRFSRLMTMLKLVFISASLFVIVSLSITKLVAFFKGKHAQQSV